jgi:putative ABC transport system permease protein
MFRLLAACRSIVHRPSADRDLDDELRSHLDREIEAQRRLGVPAEEAHRLAMRTMGAIERSKAQCRDERLGHQVGEMARGCAQDLRFGFRLLRRYAAPVSIAILGLGVAIGVVSSVFTIANATMFRPYGMDAPGEVFSVRRASEPRYRSWSYDQFLAMRDVVPGLRLEASADRRLRMSTVPNGDTLQPGRAVLFVSGGYLQTLGGRPAFGRALGAADDEPGAVPVAVVSHFTWRSEFQSDPGAVGRTLWVNDVPVTLVGVLQAEFTGPQKIAPAVWLSLAASRAVLGGGESPDADRLAVEVVTRLPSDTNRSVLEQQLTSVANTRGHDRPAGSESARPNPVVLWKVASPLAEAGGDDYPVLICIFGVVGLVLALACANAANLLSAAALTRVREIGLRLALGATRSRLMRQLLTESLGIGLMAGAVGFVLAWWLAPLFAFVIEVPLDVNLRPDGRVVGFTVVVALLCGLGAGFNPARQGARGRILSALNAQGRSNGMATPKRFRGSFVALQAAVSVFLLIPTALIARSAVKMAGTNVGFDADHVLAVAMNPLRPGLEARALMQANLAIVRALPSVEQASAVEYEPFGWNRAIDRFTYRGASYELRINYSDDAFFDATGVRLLRGRLFTPDEAWGDASVAVVSDLVARTFFSGDPLGQSLRQLPGRLASQASATVVGVVADAVMDRFEAERRGAVYFPLRRRAERPISDERFRIPLSLVVRGSDPSAAAKAIEAAFRQHDIGIRPTARLMRNAVDQNLNAGQRLLWVVGPVALLALILAVVGIYGVTSFVVNQRMAEVSVRLAIGATSVDMLRLLAGDSLRPVVIGLAVGLGLAIAASRVVAREVAVGISPYDPLAIGTAIFALLSFAILAVVVPARRVARTDPARILRES